MSLRPFTLLERSFFSRLRRSLRRLKITDPNLIALALAQAQEESSKPGVGLTDLALIHNNPFGYKWLPGRDEGRYEFVEAGPNAWERAHGIGPQRYRQFDCLCAAVDSWNYMLFNSTLEPYASAREHYPADFERFLLAVCSAWAQDPAYGSEIYRLWNDWRSRLDNESTSLK